MQLFDSEKLNYLFPFTVITICFGVELQKVGAPKYTVYVVIGYIVYHVLMEITLKIYDLFAERQNSGNCSFNLIWKTITCMNSHTIQRKTAWTDIFINFCSYFTFILLISLKIPLKKNHVYSDASHSN